MIKISKKITSLLLAGVATMAILPSTVFAEGNTADKAEEGILIEEGSDSVIPKASDKKVPEDGSIQYKSGWNKLNSDSWVYANEDKTLVKDSWLKVNNVWYHFYPNGIMQTEEWVNDNGTWYYLNETGAMQTGWFKDGRTWYYLGASGAMQTGWLNINGTWYYFNSNGSMAHDTTIDGYTLNSSGAWVQ